MDIATDPENDKPVVYGDVNLDYLKIRKASIILRSLNHELRQKIINIIFENKKTTVTEIYTKLQIEQSIVSQHLALLRRSGVLKTEKNKKFIYYFINEKKLKDMCDCVDVLAK